MARLRGFARLAVVVVLLISLVGCATRPPEWAYFDAGRHPVGGSAAVGGYYVGAYVVWPVVFTTLLIVELLSDGSGATYSAVRDPDAGPSFFGTGTGLIVGAPFHYLTLPFQSWEAEPPPEDRGRKVDDRPMP